MRLRLLSFPCALAALSAHSIASACDPVALLHRAISPDASEAAEATQVMRLSGQYFLNGLLDLYHDDIQTHLATPHATDPDGRWQRIQTAIDAVAGQRDAYASGLFWHTDLDEACRMARSTGRPILSLRLLGQLTDEHSCANSRYFRTVLYANHAVSETLRERYVLHWKSERPVPRLTVDFGDGRRLERTITGNSVHYVLDADGRPMDALPGLYGPGAFLEALERSACLASALSDAAPRARLDILAAHHTAEHERLQAEWWQQLAALRILPPAAPGKGRGADLAGPPPADGTPANGVPAAIAARRAVTKSVIEMAVISDAFDPTPPDQRRQDDPVWRKLAARNAGLARLDAGSRSLMAVKHCGGRACLFDGVPGDHGPAHGDLANKIRTLEYNLALDTVRNAFSLHNQVHKWFMQRAVPADLETLNERVYRELFLTPADDPWLGLLVPEAYTALDAEGVVFDPAGAVGG